MSCRIAIANSRSSHIFSTTRTQKPSSPKQSTHSPRTGRGSIASSTRRNVNRTDELIRQSWQFVPQSYLRRPMKGHNMRTLSSRLQSTAQTYEYDNAEDQPERDTGPGTAS